MIYCQGKDSAILKYKFKNEREKIVTFRNTPITVLLKSLIQLGLQRTEDNIYYHAYGRATLGISGVIQTIRWKSSGRILGALRTHIFQYGDLFQTEIIFNNDGGKRAKLDRINDDGEVTSPRISADPNNCVLDYLVAESGDLRGQIRVSHNNKLIYVDEGVLPCEFEVSCEGCPPGFMRCKSTNYPGYYCVPCREIKAELIAARLAVRSLKNG